MVRMIEVSHSRYLFSRDRNDRFCCIWDLARSIGKVFFWQPEVVIKLNINSVITECREGLVTGRSMTFLEHAPEVLCDYPVAANYPCRACVRVLPESLPVTG